MVRAFKEEFAVAFQLRGDQYVRTKFFVKHPGGKAFASYHLRQSIWKWLQENAVHGWRWRISTGDLFFKDQNDAFAFRMRW